MAMSWKKIAFAVLLLSALAGAVIPIVQAQAPAVDPAAVQILKRMTDYMAGLQHFSVHSDNTLEDQLDSGQRVDFGFSAKVTLSRPDKLHAALGDCARSSGFTSTSATTSTSTAARPCLP